MAQRAGIVFSVPNERLRDGTSFYHQIGAMGVILSGFNFSGIVNGPVLPCAGLTVAV
jgi:hypothetical protein